MAGATLTAVTTENATSVSVDDDRFEVADGNLKLKDDMSLDFEGDDGGSVDVTITASGDGASATHTVAVTINDVNEGPSLDAADGAVDEEADGATVGAVTASDPDAGDTHTFTVSDDRFEVADGMLKLKDGMSLDHETEDSVMVTITVTDSGGLTASADVTVSVNDVNEAATVNGDVADMAFVGGEESSTEVDLKALFTDPDGDGLSYRLSDNAPDWLTLSVTTAGTGDAQTITGTLSGKPAAGAEGEVADVSIIASDDDGAEAQVMFDLIIDAENDAPTRLELRVTDDDGLVSRTTEVNVDENAMGVELGSIYLSDPDDARHPHGQHEYSVSDDRFEVSGGMLKLKADASLDREEDGSKIDLTVTATDMAKGDAAESIDLKITIMIGNVDTGDSEGPRRTLDADGNLTEIGPVTITVDEDLDEDDVDAGDWLKTIPKGLSTAFEDPDGDDLTYSLGSGAPRWLEIDEDTGRLTNSEAMLPRRGVYDITVIASDDDGNTANGSFKLAVAISDTGDEDNDEPDIRNIDEIGYEEGDGSGPVVATFEVRDDDIEIAPHPFGVHKVTFTAMQDPGDGTKDRDVTLAFKIVKDRDDGDDTAYYEIRAKTSAELAEGADGTAVLYGLVKVEDKDDDPDVYPKGHAKEGQVIPVEAIDYEEGDEIDFEVTVTDKDGAKNGDVDDRSISIDVENIGDESPKFQATAVPGGKGDSKTNTTTVKTKQQHAPLDRDVLVMRLDELWDDADTDDDDLSFDVGGTDDLPDWIKVYGPDRWEDIYENRRTDLTDAEVDAVTGVRDRDEVVVVVIDRTAKSGEDVSLTGGSFTISAEDRDGNSSTETIMIDVTNTNVSPPDATKVVSISGGDPNKDKEITGTGNLTMNVNFSLDPDLKGGESPFLVLYTWSVTTDVADDGDADNGDETVNIISVSSTPQPLMLGVRQTDGTMARNTAYIDETITAKVEIFEVDPETGKLTSAQKYSAEVDVASAAKAPVTPPLPTKVSFGDITTDTSGVLVTIYATGEAAEAGATVQLESSPTGTGNTWTVVDSEAVNTSTGSATIDGESGSNLDVDANGDGTSGDGGGRYYRVAYVYEGKDGDPNDDSDNVKEYSEVIRLGSVTSDPDDINLIGPSNPGSGDTLRVNNLTATVEVQWQVGEDGKDENETIDAHEWTDLAGQTGLTLKLTDDHAGKSVRAKLTYKGDEDNPSYVTWVDYSTPAAAVTPLPTSPNNPADRTQETYWIEVNLNADNDDGRGTGDVSDFFFDTDGDDLTYSLVGSSVDDTPLGGIQDGNTVFRTSQAEAAETGNAGAIIFTLNGETGEVTFYTNRALSHDNNAADEDSDGAGNWFTVTVQANDGKPDPVGTDPDLDPLADDDPTDDLTVNVRVNVAPTAIHLGGSAIEDDATATATVSGISLAETDDFDAATAGGTTSVALDVQDLNDGIGDGAHSYGTHKVTVDDKRFEVVSEVASGGDEDNDASTWVLRVKDGAKFDFEDANDKDADTTIEGKQIVLKITATDGGGQKTEGYVTFTLTDVSTNDPQDNQPTSSGAGSGGVMTTGGGAGDDDNGPGNAPGDGGLWVESDFMDEDLFESYMLIIDDIDIA